MVWLTRRATLAPACPHHAGDLVLTIPEVEAAAGIKLVLLVSLDCDDWR